MEPILALAREFDLRVVEDCAQAHGAQYHGRSVGSLGCVAAFSFCHEKAMTTAGEGGMLVTSDTAVFERAMTYRDHGTDFGAASVADPSPGYRWLRSSVGTNLRLSEVQSAVGRLQLQRLQQEVQQLRGQVELQQHEISTMKRQPLGRRPHPRRGTGSGCRPRVPATSNRRPPASGLPCGR